MLYNRCLCSYPYRTQIHYVRNVEFVKAKPVGTYSQHRALKGYISDISLKYWRFPDSAVCCRVYVPHTSR